MSVDQFANKLIACSEREREREREREGGGKLVDEKVMTNVDCTYLRE